MNKSILNGHIGNDIDSNTVNSNGNEFTVSEFSIATKRFLKDKGELTDWHNIKLWNHAKLLPYLKKGAKVLVEGYSTTERWEKDGQKFQKTIVTVESIELQSLPKSDSPDDSGNPF